MYSIFFLYVRVNMVCHRNNWQTLIGAFLVYIIYIFFFINFTFNMFFILSLFRFISIGRLLSNCFIINVIRIIFVECLKYSIFLFYWWFWSTKKKKVFNVFAEIPVNVTQHILQPCKILGTTISFYVPT